MLFLFTSVTNQVTTKHIGFAFWEPVKSRIWQKESLSLLLISQRSQISGERERASESPSGSSGPSDLTVLSDGTRTSAYVAQGLICRALPGWPGGYGITHTTPSCPDCSQECGVQAHGHRGDEVVGDSFFPFSVKALPSFYLLISQVRAGL